MQIRNTNVLRRTLASCGLWLIAATAQGALVNAEPDVWRDTETNLEWLSLNLTTTEAPGLTDPGDEFSTATATDIMAASVVSDYVVNQGFAVAATSAVAALCDGSGGVADFTGGLNVLPQVMSLGITTSWVFSGPFSFYKDQGIFRQSGLHVADDNVSLRNSCGRHPGSTGGFFRSVCDGKRGGSRASLRVQAFA